MWRASQDANPETGWAGPSEAWCVLMFYVGSGSGSRWHVGGALLLRGEGMDYRENGKSRALASSYVTLDKLHPGPHFTLWEKRKYLIRRAAVES